MVSPPVDEIRHMALRIAESESLELVDVEFKPGKSRSLLRIYIDKVGGVTLDDCENVSRQMSALLDVKDVISSAYVLEVSSPGLDRPFKTDRDYERSIGRYVRVHYNDADGKPQQVAGTLVAATDAAVRLEDGGRMTDIPREAVRRAHQDILMPAHPRKDKRKK